VKRAVRILQVIRIIEAIAGIAFGWNDFRTRNSFGWAEICIALTGVIITTVFIRKIRKQEKRGK